MKRYIIILVLLMTFYPFIGGQKGCGGSGGIEIAEPMETATMYGVGTQELEQGLTYEEGEGVAPEAGPANLICEPEPEEEELRKPPGCLAYLPQGFDLYMIIDSQMTLRHMEDIKNIGAFENILGRIAEGVKRIAPNIDPADLAQKMSEVCFACMLKEGTAGALSKASADSSFGLGQCQELIFADMFLEPFSLEDALKDAGKEILKDEKGRIKLGERFVGVQVKDDVIVVGTKYIDKLQDAQGNVKGNISEGEAGLIAQASPATIAVLATNKGMRAFADDQVIEYFKPMFSFVKFDFESRILSALNFAKYVSMGTKIFDMEKLKAGEDALVMKMFLEMAYDEFQFLMKSLGQKAVEVKEGAGDTVYGKPPSSDAIEGRAVQSGDNAISGTAVPSEDNAISGTAVPSEDNAIEGSAVEGEDNAIGGTPAE